MANRRHEIEAPDAELIELEPFDVSQPAFIIILDVEATRPRVTCTARTHGERDRLKAWIRDQPRLLALLAEATVLAWGDDWVDEFLGDQ